MLFINFYVAYKMMGSLWYIYRYLSVYSYYSPYPSVFLTDFVSFLLSSSLLLNNNPKCKYILIKNKSGRIGQDEAIRKQQLPHCAAVYSCGIYVAEWLVTLQVSKKLNHCYCFQRKWSSSTYIYEVQYKLV